MKILPLILLLLLLLLLMRFMELERKTGKFAIGKRSTNPLARSLSRIRIRILFHKYTYLLRLPSNLTNKSSSQTLHRLFNANSAYNNSQIFTFPSPRQTQKLQQQRNLKSKKERNSDDTKRASSLQQDSVLSLSLSLLLTLVLLFSLKLNILT